MSDKSPGHGKSPKGKSIKEKRADKRAKADGGDAIDPVAQLGKKR
jgi:hypothetical protein